MANQGPLPSGFALRRAELQCARWSIALVFAITVIWTLFQETDAKYLLYVLPFVIPFLHLAAQQGKLQFYTSGLIALMAYIAVGLGSLLYNDALGFFAYRDLLIICGYLCLFAIFARSPPFVADLGMVTLAIGLVIEAAKNGVGLNVDFAASQGIVESVLAFPLGLIFLYYFHERKWVRAMIALVLLFLAFKRMALFAAIVVVSIDLAFSFIGSKSINRYAAAVFVVLCSLAAMSSIQIFGFFADTFAPDGINANNVSLGRWELASILWDHIDSHGYSFSFLGFGPGASDHLIFLAEGVAENPHNDWLKLFFDYGVIGLLGGHLILYVTFTRNSLGVMIYIYTAILMMTTNPLVYMFYFVFAFLIIRIVLKPRIARPLFSFGPSRQTGGRPGPAITSGGFVDP